MSYARKKTPKDLAGIMGTRNNKWKTLIENASQVSKKANEKLEDFV